MLKGDKGLVNIICKELVQINEKKVTQGEYRQFPEDIKRDISSQKSNKQMTKNLHLINNKVNVNKITRCYYTAVLLVEVGRNHVLASMCRKNRSAQRWEWASTSTRRN